MNIDLYDYWPKNYQVHLLESSEYTRKIVQIILRQAFEGHIYEDKGCKISKIHTWFCLVITVDTAHLYSSNVK